MPRARQNADADSPDCSCSAIWHCQCSRRDGGWGWVMEYTIPRCRGLWLEGFLSRLRLALHNHNPSNRPGTKGIAALDLPSRQIQTVISPATITSGGPTQMTRSPIRAAGLPPIKTEGEHGGAIGLLHEVWGHRTSDKRGRRRGEQRA